MFCLAGLAAEGVSNADDVGFGGLADEDEGVAGFAPGDGGLAVELADPVAVLLAGVEIFESAAIRDGDEGEGGAVLIYEFEAGGFAAVNGAGVEAGGLEFGGGLELDGSTHAFAHEGEGFFGAGVGGCGGGDGAEGAADAGDLGGVEPVAGVGAVDVAADDEDAEETGGDGPAVAGGECGDAAGAFDFSEASGAGGPGFFVRDGDAFGLDERFDGDVPVVALLGGLALVEKCFCFGALFGREVAIEQAAHQEVFVAHFSWSVWM